MATVQKRAWLGRGPTGLAATLIASALLGAACVVPEPAGLRVCRHGPASSTRVSISTARTIVGRSRQVVIVCRGATGASRTERGRRAAEW